MNEATHEPIAEAVNLTKLYARQHNPWRAQSGAAARAAVNNITFAVTKNEILGLVGESGCGKTTLGKLMLKLVEPDAGHVFFDGIDITDLRTSELRPVRRHMQMIFQDLDAALNPRMKIDAILKEAVQLHRRGMNDVAVAQRVAELLDAVKLSKNKLTRYAHELSGGEKRRVGIARALAVGPRFIVADEPTSALDVSIQAQIVNLLHDLHRQLGLSYLFISHDLRLVEMLSHRIAVMYRGEIVEVGTTETIVSSPRHPYTVHLWSAIARDTDAQDTTQGCPYTSECSMYQQAGKPEICSRQAPTLRDVAPQHQVACHYAR